MTRNSLLRFIEHGTPRRMIAACSAPESKSPFG